MPERYLGKSLGKYRVEELIGSGGFAWVYRGFDPTLGIPVALKVLKPQFAGDPQFEERFRREASTAARLRHPNIVKIYEVGKDGDAVYFAMDYLPSGLASRLETQAFLPEEVVLRVGIDVAKAIGFAHREGVIHRDIKVDNILFDVHGNAVVADFGIARAVSGYTQQTGTNMVVGTPQYFAPEQARAKPLDGRADVYSLGVSLYRAVAGRLPFEGEDWYEIARAHVEAEPPPPRQFNPDISPAFQKLILRCLAKHPDDRPATGEQLADELSAILALPRPARGGRPASPGAFLSPTETPTVTERPLSSGRRRKGSRLARRVGATVLALAGVGVVGVFILAQRAAPTVAATPPVIAGVTARFDSSLADSLRGATPGDTIGSVIDSIARARGDSGRKVAPATGVGRLDVRATDGARLSVNGIDVGTTTWSSDTLRAGTPLAVRASIAAPEGCPTAFANTTVRLRPGGREQVNLPVRTCGTLRIALRNRPLPEQARYALAGEGITRNGELPMSGELLPVGVYEVVISAPGCQEFRTSVTIAAGALDRTAVLDCSALKP